MEDNTLFVGAEPNSRIQGLVVSSTPEIQPAVSYSLMGVVQDTEHRQFRWYLDWGNVALLATVIISSSYLLFLMPGWGNNQSLSVVQELATLPVMLAGIVFAWRTAYLLNILNIDRQVQRAWMLYGFAFLPWLIADVSRAFSSILGESYAWSPLVSACYPVSLVLIISGILMFSTVGVGDDKEPVLRLDTSIILLGVIALVAFFIIGPLRLRYSVVTGDDFRLFLFATLTATAVLMACNVLVRRPTGGAATPLLITVAGLTILCVMDLGWTYFAVRSEVINGWALYAAWMLGQLALVASPQVHYSIIRRQRSVELVDSLVYRLHRIIPYIAAAVGMFLLTSTGFYVLMEFMGIVVLLVLGVSSLIVIRQIVSLRQNARLQAAQAIRDTENWFQALVMYSSDMVTVVDHNCLCRYQSPSAADISRYLPDQVIGSDFMSWIHEVDRQNVCAAIQSIINSQTEAATAKVEWRLNTDDDACVHFETIISNRLDDPTVNGLVLNSRDITDRKDLEDRLTYQAFHDPLTNLPNRMMFFSLLEQAMKRVGPKRGIALLFVDIDDFKLINDRYGHETGDRFLQALSRRLESSLRPGDTLSRLAGDEFTILLHDISSPDEADAVTQRVLEALKQPIQIENHTATISTSIGIAFTTDPNLDPGQLIHRADTAMYSAKNSGNGRTVLYEPALAEPASFSLEQRL